MVTTDDILLKRKNIKFYTDIIIDNWDLIKDKFFEKSNLSNK